MDKYRERPLNHGHEPQSSLRGNIHSVSRDCSDVYQLLMKNHE